ncbi:hypothetical protein QRX60_17790 [Amycolatopsis mongoliensis]|uniref:Uncharacterized protein n=1 Tax=Amycolatopsis mongoliensis TaxID=715475 RepID=A0A9Y2NL06_9PSEU|nr:hypothetical protein [Amycolatopsis sp. 4-36]WIY05609.1 hypothetical protein QRX60_17790 [Amycolatopsis sp. 4-36]
MINDLRMGGAVEFTAQDLLGALDLLRPTGAPDRWRLTAAAARYRDPRVVAVNARLELAGCLVSAGAVVVQRRPLYRLGSLTGTELAGSSGVHRFL